MSLYDSIMYKFLSLFKNVVLRSLKFFVQLDHQADISVYIMETTALHHYWYIIMMHFESHKPFGFPAFNINLISFQFHINCSVDYMHLIV